MVEITLSVNKSNRNRPNDPSFLESLTGKNERHFSGNDALCE